MDQYVENGESVTVQKGGYTALVYQMPSDEGDWMTNVWYSFYVNRSISDTNRIRTDLVDGRYYYYNQSIWFEDTDDEWMIDSNMEWEIYNKTTGEVKPGCAYFSVDEVGEYEVTIYDKVRKETLTFEFAIVIDQANPLIYLVERDYLTETSISNGAITSAGMKIIYEDDIEVQEMTYEYTTFQGRYEKGTVQSGFIFYRKGEYRITVTDMAENRSVATFTITDYDLVVDPKGARTVGTVEITCVHKQTDKVSKIVITVLP